MTDTITLPARVKTMLKKPSGVLAIIAVLMGGGSFDVDIRYALINLSNTVVKKLLIEVPENKMTMPEVTMKMRSGS